MANEIEAKEMTFPLKLHDCMFVNCKEPGNNFRFVWNTEGEFPIPVAVEYVCKKHKDLHEKDLLNGTPLPS